MKDVIGPIIFFIVGFALVVSIAISAVNDMNKWADKQKIRNGYLNKQLSIDGDTLTIVGFRGTTFYLSNGIKVEEIIIEQNLIK